MTKTRIFLSIFLTLSIISTLNSVGRDFVVETEMEMEMNECITDYQLEVLECQNLAPFTHPETVPEEYILKKNKMNKSEDFYETEHPQVWEL